MSSSAAVQPEAMPIVACTVSRDVQLFDLLIEDMETVLGEQWGDLNFEDAVAFLMQPEADDLQFLAIALDADDEKDLGPAKDVIRAANAKDIKVILITEDISANSLHALLRAGGNEFLPYPLPDGELAQAIKRVTAPPPVAVEEDPARHQSKLKATDNRSGVVIPVHGMAGGVGATTFAVNLAWELANIDPKDPPRVVILDFDLQFGSVSTYLDLPRRESVLELLTDTESMDSDVFMQALLAYDNKLHVLTAPTDLVPLDLVTPPDIARLIEIARTNFDYVIIDMPSSMVEWSQAVLEASHVYFALLELDMRSAQNTLRLKRALQSEDLPFEKLRFVLNRAPSFTDLNGKARAKRLAESLGISIEVHMPDGKHQVSQQSDHGVPLGVGVPKNNLRKEVAKLAASVHAVNEADDKAVRA